MTNKMINERLASHSMLSALFKTAVGINGGIAAGANVSAAFSTDFGSGAGIGAVAGLSAHAPADVENAFGNVAPPPPFYMQGDFGV